MLPSAFNHTTTLLSFEQDISEPKIDVFEATGDFKSRIESSAVDDRDLYIIDSGK